MFKAGDRIGFFSENSTPPHRRKTTPRKKLISRLRIFLDSFVKLSETYIRTAKLQDSFLQAADKAVKVAYSISTLQNNPQKALTLLSDLLLEQEQITDSFLLASLYLKRGRAYAQLDLEKAIDDYQTAIKTFSVKDSIHIADAYLFSARAYSNLGKFVEAGDSFRNASTFFEALKDYEYMYYAQQGIITMFSMNGFHEKAMKEREKNLKKIESLELTHHLPTEYYNQALDYEKIGNKIKYLEYLFKAKDAIDNSRKNNLEISNEMYVYAELVDYYCESGQLSAAEDYLALINQFHKNSQKNYTIIATN